MSTLLEHVRRAYMVSTPLVSIGTPDAASTVVSVVKEIEAVQAKNGKHGVSLQWDAVRGMTPASSGTTRIKQADAAIGLLSYNNDPLLNPVEVLNRLTQVEQGSIVFLHNAHLLIAPDGKPAIDIVQGIYNLRDLFKVNQRMLVLLSPGMTMPRELAHDVMTYEEPLPDGEALKAVVTSVYEAGHDQQSPGAALIEDAVEALSGLSSFTSEQVTAMSLTKEGLDIEGLWDRKKAMIDDTPGLTIWKPTTTLDDVIGYGNCTSYLKKFIDRQDINLVVWVDEIEKQLHGAEGESNGIVMDQVNVLLQDMEKNNYHGMVFMGAPGTGKSMTAQSTGILTCQLDFGALMNSLVGESQSRLRQAMSIIHAVSRGKVLFLATCNSTAALNPALMRRFKSGKFYFDLPNAEDRTAIWQHYCDRHGYTDCQVQNHPVDDGWSPANIKVCVETADSMGILIDEAAEYIVPEGQASARSIEALRSQAEGVWISASESGPYHRPTKTPSEPTRKIDVASFDPTDAHKLN
jgi:hypothetical protein